MAYPSLPETIDGLTPRLLTALVRNSPHWRGGEIRSVRTALLKDAGMTSLAYRVEAELAGQDAPCRHRSLFVKMHRPGARKWEYPPAAAEVFFYNHLAHRSGMTVPETWFAHYDLESSRYLLVQEFLDPDCIGDARTMLSRADLTRVLRSMARLHATWWDSPELAELSMVRDQAALMKGGIDRMVSGEIDIPGFVKRYRRLIGPAARRHYSRMAKSKPRPLPLSGHTTLVHYDISAKNICLPDDPALPPVIFDWGLLARANPGVDVATFLTYSTSNEDHDWWPELLHGYLDALATFGVDDYSFDELWLDFRSGVLMRQVAPVALFTRSPAALELALVLLSIVNAAAVTTKAFELLEEG